MSMGETTMRAATGAGGESASQGLGVRLAARPLFMCGFRPFFLLTALYAVLVLLAWSGFLGFGLAVPAVAGGPLVWHAHELMFGFGLAAVAGFVLTAVPEFTATPTFAPRVVLRFVLLWLAARAAFWLSGALVAVAGGWLDGADGQAARWLGHLPAALLEIGFACALLAAVAPRLWRDPERRQLGFLWGLAAMAAVVAGFHLDVLRGEYPMRWVLAGLGVMMALVVVAMSRISMRVMNDALDAQRARRLPARTLRHVEEAELELPAYRARPPRRNLAIAAIAVYTVAELLLPGSPITGWLGLGAAAAVFNLLNDWHVGRALFTRWAFLLYAVYWLLALGYLLLGLAHLGAPLAPSAGTHLLAIGAMGLSILAVLCIAGRTHAGYPLDERPWVGVAAGSIALAAMLRAAAGLPDTPASALQLLAALAWIVAFALVVWCLGVLFVAARVDGGGGCEEYHEAGLAEAAPR
jgi:uncharacterized protein involved in response to NO